MACFSSFAYSSCLFVQVKCEEGGLAFLSTEGHVHGCWMNVVTERREILLALFGIVLITSGITTDVNIAFSLCPQILSQDCTKHVMTLKIVSFK